MSTCFIYSLWEPDGSVARYIGKTVDPDARLKSHCSNPSSDCLREWIKDLDDKGLKPVMHIVEEVPIGYGGWREAFHIEVYRRRGHLLLNQVDLWFKRTTRDCKTLSVEVQPHRLKRIQLLAQQNNMSIRRVVYELLSRAPLEIPFTTGDYEI